VLAFSQQLPESLELGLIGDVVACAQVINQHADRHGVERQAHWARIIAHGVLHLLGFTHDRAHAAREMESTERAILHRLGLHHPELHEYAS